MVRVFYLVYGLTSGGIERYSVNIYKRIDKKKYNLDFIVKKNSHDFFDEEFYSAGGVKIPLSAKGKHFKIISKILYLFNLIRLIRKNRYDIAYFNLSTPSDVFKYPLVCRVFGINKIIIHSHNSYEDGNDKIKNLINKMGRSYINRITAARFACSDVAARWMFGEKVQENKEYKLITNGLETEKYDFNQKVREKMRNNLEIEKDELVLGHVGRFVEQKNHVILLKIFKSVLKKRKNSKLVLIGVGPLMEQIKDLSKKMGIFNNIIFLGERSNVNEYLQAVDVFVLPSLYEGLPIAGVEAQASGLPCVFSNTISREVNITGNVKFLGLTEPLETWSTTIIEAGKQKRVSQSLKIEKAGFDITHSTKQVEKTIDNLMN